MCFFLYMFIYIHYIYIYIYDSKDKGNKNKQVGLYQTKKFLHSKGNHQQNEKATYGMGKYLQTIYLNKELISKIYKDSYNSIAKKKIIKKMAKDLNRHFSRRHTNGQQVHEKVLNITNHQGNANQNHNEISPHTVRMAIIKKTRNNKCWQGCGKKGTLVHCWWECKLVQPLWKTVWRFLKKLKIELPYDPAIPLLGIYPKEMKSGSQRDI